ncbi:hypothetical protein HMI54_003246 [Coelomomyces lativittatus]|nr:hypothetical protein HMI56_007627 [Coelomomyces lativittatus]KAJ1517790.1 hypothetical protein HMI55_005941 [Coelomomyces lativittatus]KAJ1517953.1 hypothetical protein HMI54_003246 [Coelomomyces lativittatus]
MTSSSKSTLSPSLSFPSFSFSSSNKSKSNSNATSQSHKTTKPSQLLDEPIIIVQSEHGHPSSDDPYSFHSSTSTLKGKDSNLKKKKKRYEEDLSSSSSSTLTKKRKHKEKEKKRSNSSTKNRKLHNGSRSQFESFLNEFSTLLFLDTLGDPNQRTMSCLNPYSVPKYRRHTNQVLGLPPMIEIDTLASQKSKFVHLKLKGTSSFTSFSRFFHRSSTSTSTKTPPTFFLKTLPLIQSSSSLPDEIALISSSENENENENESENENENENEREGSQQPSSSFSKRNKKLNAFPEPYQSQLLAFQKLLLDEPNRVEVWLNFTAFQSNLHPSGGPSLLDRQCCILERAMKHHPSHPDLLNMYFELGTQFWDPERIELRFQHHLPRYPPLILNYMAWKQTQVSVHETMQLLKTWFATYPRRPSSSTTLESPPFSSTALHVFLRMLRYLWEAGYTERVIALVQAQFKETLFHESPRRSSDPWWDSDQPRLGEPSTDEERNKELNRGSTSNLHASFLPSSFFTHLPDDPFQQWVHKETLLHPQRGLPQRSTDPDVLDPYAVVMWEEDLEGWLLPMSSMNDVKHQRELVFSVLHVLGFYFTDVPWSVLKDPYLATNPFTASASSLLFLSMNHATSIPQPSPLPTHLDEDEPSFSSSSSSSSSSPLKCMHQDQRYFTSFLTPPSKLPTGLRAFWCHLFQELSWVDPIFTFYLGWMDPTLQTLFEQTFFCTDLSMGLPLLASLVMSSQDPDDPSSSSWPLFPILCRWVEHAWHPSTSSSSLMALKVVSILLHKDALRDLDPSTLSVPTHSQRLSIQSLLKNQFQLNLTYSFPPFPTFRDLTFALAPITLLVYFNSILKDSMDFTEFEWALSLTTDSFPLLCAHIHRERLRCYVGLNAFHPVSSRSLTTLLKTAWTLPTLHTDAWLVQWIPLRTLWLTPPWTPLLPLFPTHALPSTWLRYPSHPLTLTHASLLRVLYLTPWVHRVYFTVFQHSSLFNVHELLQILERMRMFGVRVRCKVPQLLLPSFPLPVP